MNEKRKQILIRQAIFLRKTIFELNRKDISEKEWWNTCFADSHRGTSYWWAIFQLFKDEGMDLNKLAPLEASL